MSAQTPIIKPEQLIEIASHIKTFEYEGNYAKLYFDTNFGTDEVIQKQLNEIGIKEILHKHTDMTGAIASGHSFILDYQNSTQKKTIDVLHHNFVRMSALKQLFANGGIKLSNEEQSYFDKEAARLASIKAASKVK